MFAEQAKDLLEDSGIRDPELAEKFWEIVSGKCKQNGGCTCHCKYHDSRVVGPGCQGGNHCYSRRNGCHIGCNGC